MSEIISVCVLSYNSSSTIVETLDSILNQNFELKHIELIISDDYSSDKTVSIISDWLNENQSKFFNCVLLTGCNNIGVSANCDRAWRTAIGSWIKTLAADDKLVESCLSDYINYTKVFGKGIYFSYMECFGGHIKESTLRPLEGNLLFFSLTAKQQYKYLIESPFNIAPTSFINRDILESIGFAETKYRNFEDLPLWLKLTKNGHKLCFMEKVTVKYRIGESLSNTTSFIVNKVFFGDLKKLYSYEIWPNQSIFSLRKIEKKVEFALVTFSYYLFKNKKNKFYISLAFLFSKLRVSLYVDKIKSIIVKRLKCI